MNRYWRALLTMLCVLAMAQTLAAQESGGIDYMLLGRAGTNYFNVPGESQLSAAGGFDVAAQLFGNVGVVASLNGGYVTTGAQMVGTVGVVKLPDAYGESWFDPISFSAYFDQFTDTRIDTVAGRLYLSQARFQLGLALSENLEIGGMFSQPTNEDNDVLFLFENFPAALPTPGRVDSSRTYGAYVSSRIRDLQSAIVVGHRSSADTMYFGLNLRRPLGDQVALFGTANYEHATGNWGAIGGVEIAIGPNLSRGSRYASSGDAEYAVRIERARPVQVRAQSPDSTTRLVNLPRGPLSPPELGSGRFPLGLGDAEQETVGFEEYDDSITSSWTQRYFNWNTRQATVLMPHEVWRGLAGKGLTDRTQNAIQSPFTRFNLQTNGRFGRTDGLQ